jgi:lipopolysaccharide transport system permease protein
LTALNWESGSYMLEQRDVIWILVKKDFKIRYRHSALGFIWSLLNPLSTMTILTLVFSLLLKSDIQNFPVFLLSALLPWRFFSIGTMQATGTIAGNPSLVKKIYLPRYVLVLTNNLASFISFLMEFAALLPIMIALGMMVTPYMLLLPVIMIIEFLMVLGISLALASLSVFYRDFYQIWEIALQLGFFFSPIFYDAKIIPERYRFYYSLNPVTRIIESTRKILFYNTLPAAFDIVAPLLIALLLLIVGYTIFRRLEPRFAEET